MDDVINVSTHEQLIGKHHSVGSSDFKNLYDASLETGFSEAEIVSRCGRVWMDCGLNQDDINKNFTVDPEPSRVSSWLGRGSVSGKRAMPLWDELTKNSVRTLVGRLRNGNSDLRGLCVHEANCLWEEDVKLLSFNELDLAVELLASSEKFLPDQPVLYIESEKLKEFLDEFDGQRISGSTQEVTVNVLSHAEVNTLSQHAEFHEAPHNYDSRSNQSHEFGDACEREEATNPSSFDKQPNAQQALKPTFKGKHSGADSDNLPPGISSQLRAIPKDALLKLKATWPVENLSEAFKVMVDQGWIEDVPESVYQEHFTNSTLKDPVSQQTPKLNWLESKNLLHAVMKNLEITLTGVHEHFFHHGEDMTPIRSGLKYSEDYQMDKARELLKRVRP
jgi:hypothetical protein